MPLIIEDEGKLLGKKQAKVPDKLVNKIKKNLNLFGKYKKSKGFKRASSIVDDDYNKRSNKKEKIHNGDKTLSFSDIKKIDHEFKNMSINDDDVNAKNLGFILPGGNDMKNWAHDTLRKMRTAVKKVEGVPPVPKLEKEPIKPKDVNKDIKMGSANVKLTESENLYHPYYDALDENGVYKVLSDFLFGGTQKQQWTPLIQPQMYKKALSEFTKYGKFIHFPTKYIYQWIGIIMNNTAKLNANTQLAGHDTSFPFYELKDVIETYPEEFENSLKKFGGELNDDNCYSILDDIGLYDWMSMPDGSDAWSDYGLPKLEEIISEYDENMTPEQTIVIINKALDCVHPRGDLSSIFIVGGAKTLSRISENVKRNKKIVLNENQLLILKEYHDQTVFNFDNEGNAYFEKNNWENYVDFLEYLGTPGELPKSSWGMTEIENAVENAKKQNSNFYEEDIDEYDYIDAFLELVYDAILGNNKNNKERIFTEEFFNVFNGIEEFAEKNNYYITSDVIERYLRYSTDILDEVDEMEGYLTPYGYSLYQTLLEESFYDKIYEYDMVNNMTINDRGLIYIERNITIPNFNSPKFNYNGNNNFYKYLKKSFYDLGNCFSWEEGRGESYNGFGFGENGVSEIKLKCWVDPKDINWEATVYRNCYSLRDEKEIYIDKSGAKVEVFDVILIRGKINGVDVSGKSLLKTPIIINY